MLFTTDSNTLGGNVTWFSIHDSGLLSESGVWETVTAQSSVFNQSQPGRELFIAFYGFRRDGDVTSTGFASIDDIEVTVIPEPATVSLISGLLIITLAIVRRRRLK